MTTELDANQILPEPPQRSGSPSSGNIPLTLCSSLHGRSIAATETPDAPDTDTASSPSPEPTSRRFPKPLLVKARTTGDYVDHLHKQSRRRFLLEQGGPLAAREFRLQDDYGLDELRAPPILQDEDHIPVRDRRKSLEQVWSQKSPTPVTTKRQRLRDDFAVGSWITFLSIWGALARIGLSALSHYPGQPTFELIWAQFVGCMVMGFL